MEGDRRRQRIVQYLLQAEKPVSGSALAAEFGVSRQVIVQDIALLRATDKNILSTNKGYMIYQAEPKDTRVKQSFAVSHTDRQMQDELYTIIDQGGTVLDVVIEHEIYGQITADLLLRDRGDVDEFIQKIRHSTAKPLKELTGGIHYHTVEADTAEKLSQIEEKLRLKGYLVE